MNSFMKFAEIVSQESQLAKLAKEIPNKETDVNELDKPLSTENTSDSCENKELRPLTEEEKVKVQEKTGWSDEQMKKCSIYEDGIIYYKCDNEHLEGKKHEQTGIEYIRKTIDINYVQVEVVVPEIPSDFDVQLPDELLKESNSKQFKGCNEQLKNAIDKDETLKSKFTSEQIDDIMDGYTPEGYTWHHDAEVGKMQLVETKLHDRTQGGVAHTGGKSLWGGGY